MGDAMRWFAAIFLVLVMVAAVFGFGVVGPSTAIAKILFFLLLVIFLVTSVAGFTNGRSR
jgi:uncharacterized membrane protein YtjA (UPF0391 family)